MAARFTSSNLLVLSYHVLVAIPLLSTVVYIVSWGLLQSSVFLLLLNCFLYSPLLFPCSFQKRKNNTGTRCCQAHIQPWQTQPAEMHGTADTQGGREQEGERATENTAKTRDWRLEPGGLCRVIGKWRGPGGVEEGASLRLHCITPFCPHANMHHCSPCKAAMCRRTINQPGGDEQAAHSKGRITHMHWYISVYRYMLLSLLSLLPLFLFHTVSALTELLVRFLQCTLAEAGS